MDDLALHLVIGAASTASVCVEANFLVGLSGRARRPFYFVCYVTTLYSGLLLANRLSFEVALSPLLHQLLTYATIFLARALFAHFALGLRRSDACSGAMVLLSVKIIVDALYPFLLVSLTILLRSILGGRPSILPSLLLAGLAQVASCALLLEIIRRRFWPRSTEPSSAYLGIVLIPCTLLVFTLEMSMNVHITEVGRWGVTVLGNSDDGFSARTLAALSLSLAVLFVTLYAYRRLCESIRGEREAAALAQEVGAQKRYVAEARERYESYRSFRHDLKNHVLTLSGLLAGGKTEEALTYLGRMGDIADAFTFPVDSGNPAVDALLSQKLQAARGRKIVVSADVALRGVSGVSDFDLCVVLSNIVDNAVEACVHENTAVRFLDVAVSARGGFLVLKVRNGCPADRCIVEGQGLRNVRMVAEKYAGTMEVGAEAGIATTAVLICFDCDAR